MSLRKNDQVLVMFTSLRIENNVASSDIPLVCEFPNVFPENIFDLSSVCEVEFP